MISRRFALCNNNAGVIVPTLNTTSRTFSQQTQKLFSWKAPNLGVGVKKPPPTVNANNNKKAPGSASPGSKNSQKKSTETTTNGGGGGAEKPLSWTERFNEWRKQTSVKKLVLIHGPVFGTWYFILNTCIQLSIASMLHYNLAGHIVESRELAVKFGMEARFDEYANKTYYLLGTPLAVNGRFIANYVVVVSMMAPLIPVKISWTLASYPFVLKLIPSKWRPVWRGNIKG